MLLLAGWSHSTSGAGWLIAGHAIRCAVQLGVHKALPRLERRKARQNQSLNTPASDTGPGLFTPASAPGEVNAGKAEMHTETGKATEKSDRAEKVDRELIIKARTWCALYVIEAQ